MKLKCSKCSWSDFGLNHEDGALFVTSQWQKDTGKTAAWFVVVREAVFSRIKPLS